MKIAVASDHAGLDYKLALSQHLSQSGHDVVDYGAHDETPVDYPDFIPAWQVW